MNSETETTRNPFGAMDVPDPNDADVMQFAASATLDGSVADANAEAWSPVDSFGEQHTILGNWSSRWNGGADPTQAIPPKNGNRVAARHGYQAIASISISTGTRVRAKD